MNSIILTLKTWLIILKIIKLVKYLLKKGLNTLNEITNAEIIKYKRHTPEQKELLNLFNDLLDTILADKTIESKRQKGKTLMSSKNGNENESENENNKTLMSSEDDNINEHDNKIKQLNDTLDEIIDKSKSFEEQLKSIKNRKSRRLLVFQRLWW